MSNSQAAMDRMIKARSGLIMQQRFWGTLALRLRLKIDVSCPTAWTDGLSIGFNPDFVLAQTIDKLKGLFCHEILHVVLGHNVRRGNRDKELWNDAADYAVNPLVIDAGLSLPDGVLLDSRFFNRTVESIYPDLTGQGSQRRQPQQQPQNGPGQPQGPGPGQPQGQPSGKPQGQDKAQQGQAQGQGQDKGRPQDKGQGQPGQDKGQGQPQQGPGQPQGQGQGQAQPQQQPQSKPGNFGEVRDLPSQQPGKEGQPASPAEMQQHSRGWAQAVVKAEMAAKAAGQGGGPGVDRLIEDIVNPRLPSEEILRRYIDQVAVNDYAWHSPDRRLIHLGIYLPGPVSNTLHDIVLVFDTSGSVSAAQMSQHAAEVSNILYLFDVTIHIYYVDSSLQGYEKVTSQDLPLSLHPKGGGGTDFRPAFRDIEDKGLQPALLIYLTDLQASSDKFPGQVPKYPVVWACTGTKDKAPFGDIISIR